MNNSRWAPLTLLRGFGVRWALVVATIDASSLAAQGTFVTSGEPLVSIGTAAGAEAYLLDGVTGALRRTDGSIVVANCSSSELRIFSAAGGHLRTTGRRGGGPGEFQYLRRIFPAGGDTIGVYDAVPQFRLSLFGPDGGFVRSFSIPNRIEVIGRFEDAYFVGRVSRHPPMRPGLYRASMTLYRIDPQGNLVDSVAGLRGIENFVSSVGRNRTVRLGRTGVTAVLPDRVVFGDQAEQVYTEYGPDLQILRRVATITRPEPVTAAVKERWEVARATMAPRGGVLGAFSDEYAEAMPAFRDMVAGTDGRIWLQDPYRPGLYPLVWTAYTEGRAVAVAELPPRFFPTQFGPDWVLGVAFDEDGVERVQLLGMQAGALPRRQLPPADAQPPDMPRCGAWASR